MIKGTHFVNTKTRKPRRIEKNEEVYIATKEKPPFGGLFAKISHAIGYFLEITTYLLGSSPSEKVVTNLSF